MYPGSVESIVHLSAEVEGQAGHRRRLKGNRATRTSDRSLVATFVFLAHDTYIYCAVFGLPYSTCDGHPGALGTAPP